MKRTTIMVDEETLLDLKQLAQAQQRSTSSLIREALCQYVIEQREENPPQNPLLGLIALGESAEPTDVADGGDEAMLRAGVDSIRGWSLSRDSTD